ncbi:MAG: hypothetical protein ACRD3J_16080, partial [Thermoanaerobaculia bacterium]
TVKTQTLFVSVFAVVVLQACSSSTEPVATCADLGLQRGSILVSVLDSASGSSIGNAVTATAIDGQYFDAVTTPDLPVYAGSAIALVSRRTGTYDVYVSKSGYHPWVAYNVVVRGNACGTEQTKVTARLQSSSVPN